MHSYHTLRDRPIVFKYRLIMTKFKHEMGSKHFLVDVIFMHGTPNPFVSFLSWYALI